MTKFAPLEEVPIGVPPVGTVYQAMEFPVAVALSETELPQLNEDGVAVTFEGTKHCEKVFVF